LAHQRLEQPTADNVRLGVETVEIDQRTGRDGRLVEGAEVRTRYLEYQLQSPISVVYHEQQRTGGGVRDHQRTATISSIRVYEDGRIEALATWPQSEGIRRLPLGSLQNIGRGLQQLSSGNGPLAEASRLFNTSLQADFDRLMPRDRPA